MTATAIALLDPLLWLEVDRSRVCTSGFQATTLE
jgi:hypothetical protein